ncbi:spindle and centriole-associated protein 1 isoform X1 [Esox lucius]|uniref:Spindle and centriole-associated protein 1 n=2 Tax=Esox lucius TaxID=8010 RepID=A0A3P8YAW0_ESOLU|nr:spindle and centriole-associated protein 1 isoform X1 [Esox lucius]
MSFVRFGRSQHIQGKRSAVRSKKASSTKREWVSTVHDLSVHKATPEELSRRHDMHRSHNQAVAHWELKEKAMRRKRSNGLLGSPPPLDPASLNIIREVFSGQFQLQDVLARSDRAMAVVKDLFGDAPRRQTGFPSVTMAPDCGSDYDLPVLQKPETPTQLSLLSQSMMDPQALNELDDWEGEHCEQGSVPSTSNISDTDTRYRVNTRKMKAKSLTRGGTRQSNRNHQGSAVSPPQTPCGSGGTREQAALNATGKIQRVRSKQPLSEPEECSSLVSQVLNPDPPITHSARKSRPSKASRGRSTETGLDGLALSSLSGNQSSMGLLQGLLDQVEVELEGQGPEEPPTAPGGDGTAGAQRSTQGLTGFSVALVSTLVRLARLLRQRTEEAQKERKERRRLEEDMKEQRVLIDALTAETLALREESAVLQAGLQQRASGLEERLDAMVLALGGLGVLRGDGDDEARDAGSVATDCPVTFCDLELPGLCPAVLLSPPRQRDNRPRSQTSAGCSLPLCNAPSLPTPSLASWPHPDSTPPEAPNSDPDPLFPQPSQDAVLSQIAELTRQNTLIRAQLGQFYPASPPPGSEVSKGQSSSRGSPGDKTEKRGSVTNGTGRTTPQAVGERETQPYEEEQETQQPVVSERPGSVEQRLLELNRQSAAARSRLLELIEQQKQSSFSSSVSPSVSPIPPLSGGLYPEPLAEQDLSPLGSRGSRLSAGMVSPQNLGAQSKRSRTPVDKLKGEGWFALSTHVK